MGCLIPGVPAKIVAMVKKTGLFFDIFRLYLSPSQWRALYKNVER